MDDKLVTCPTCRGAREMMKLGGIMGKCNLCTGTGKIKHSEVPMLKEIVPAENIGELIKKVGEAIPWSGKSSKPVTVEPIQEPQPIQDTIKVERNRALYKRKTTTA